MIGPLQITRRPRPGPWTRTALTALALLAAFMLGALGLRIAGLNPLATYTAMARASLFGGPYALSDSLVLATPLALCGLASALAFRARLWNIGAEGQLLMGAWAACGVGLFVLPANTPAPLMLLAMTLAGSSAGALWAGLAGLLKARFGTSEILVTLMLVYVAQNFINYFVFGPWSQAGFPLTALLPGSARLPRLSDAASTWPQLAGLGVHLGLGLAVLAALGLWVLLTRSRFGFLLDHRGASEPAARVAGIRVSRLDVMVLALSGALAGLAGMVELSGVAGRLQQNISPGYGFSGILVAWMARLHPLAVLPVALLLAALMVGGRELQASGVAKMLQGLLLLAVVSVEILAHYQIKGREQR